MVGCFIHAWANLERCWYVILTFGTYTQLDGHTSTGGETCSVQTPSQTGI